MVRRSTTDEEFMAMSEADQEAELRDAFSELKDFMDGMPEREKCAWLIRRALARLVRYRRLERERGYDLSFLVEHDQRQLVSLRMRRRAGRPPGEA